MKYLIILVLSGCLVLIASCSSEIGGGSLEGDGEETFQECESQTFRAVVSGEANDSTRLWLGLMQHDTLIKHGVPVLVTGNYNSVELVLQIGFWDNFPAGDYNLTAFASRYDSSVGKPRERLAASDMGTVTLQEYAGPEDQICCTENTEYPHRLYARMQKPLWNLTGASAIIRARYGKPCGYPDSSVTSFGVAYASAARMFPTSNSPTG